MNFTNICIHGAQGHLYTVLDAVRANTALRVAGVCREAGEDARWLHAALADANQTPRVYGEPREMFDREKPDIAVVSTFPHRNAAATLLALERGIHVFCEKPAAINAAEYAAVAAALRENGHSCPFQAHETDKNVRSPLTRGTDRNVRSPFLWTMMTHRFEPAFIAARNAVAGGRIGIVRMVDARKSYKLGERPDYYKSRATYAGTLSWVGIHALDWIHWLSGKKFKSVFARSSSLHNGGNGELETTAVCVCEMEDGALGSLTCDYYRPAAAPTHGDDRVRVVGTRGVIEVMDGQAVLLDSRGTTRLLPQAVPRIFDEFVRCVETGQSEFLSTEECMHTSLAALKAMESSDTGKEVHL